MSGATFSSSFSFYHIRLKQCVHGAVCIIFLFFIFFYFKERSYGTHARETSKLVIQEICLDLPTKLEQFPEDNCCYGF